MESSFELDSPAPLGSRLGDDRAATVLIFLPSFMLLSPVLFFLTREMHNLARVAVWGSTLSQVYPALDALTKARAAPRMSPPKQVA